jgi:hypothetical protein
MHADHAVDDELQPRQADALVGQLAEVEGAIGIADVHHEFHRQLRHRRQIIDVDLEIERAGVDITHIAFGA